MKTHLPVFLFSTVTVFAHAQDLPDFPPSQCLNQCELAGTCEPIAFDDFPPYETARNAITSSCQSDYLFVVEGVCQDGRKILHSGNGFTSEIRLYTVSGEFQGLLTQTDASVPPCMGQSYWPQYLQCESPTVVTQLCGTGFDTGSPAFVNRWTDQPE